MYGMYPMGFFFDPTYILVIIGIMLSMAASTYVNSTYRKYDEVLSKKGVTGTQAAQYILQSQGIHNVRSINGGLNELRRLERAEIVKDPEVLN